MSELRRIEFSCSAQRRLQNQTQERATNAATKYRISHSAKRRLQDKTRKKTTRCEPSRTTTRITDTNTWEGCCALNTTALEAEPKRQKLPQQYPTLEPKWLRSVVVVVVVVVVVRMIKQRVRVCPGTNCEVALNSGTTGGARKMPQNAAKSTIRQRGPCR